LRAAHLIGAAIARSVLLIEEVLHVPPGGVVGGRHLRLLLRAWMMRPRPRSTTLSVPWSSAGKSITSVTKWRIISSPDPPPVSSAPATRSSKNLRRGHYELGIDADPKRQLPAAFAELAVAI
jgi:hypothetical protein